MPKIRGFNSYIRCMAKKKKTKKKRSFNKRSLIKEIMKVFRLNPVLYDLQEQEKLILISPGKYKYKKNLSFIEGVVDVTTSGNAYVRVEEMEQDIFIKDNFWCDYFVIRQSQQSKSS